MKRFVPMIVLVSVVTVAGCQKKAADKPQARHDVTDITPTETAPAYGGGTYTASPAIPTPSYTPATTVTPTAAATPAAGNSYTIRKGDTFYSIARTHYGNGKDWQKIASANPGVDPQKLRVGQSIVIP